MRNPRMAGLLAGLLLLVGCTTLPDSGAVHTRKEPAPAADQAPYFAPPGPQPGDSPEEIVSGFLTAMQANPPGAEVARRFLTRNVQPNWNPSLGTIVYETAPVSSRGNVVRVRFNNAQRLDARGSWIPGPTGRADTMEVRVVLQEGEWRISDPPDALAVPTTYFGSLFQAFDLYFFDRSRKVLVPQRIYLPTGEQTTTNLVRRLLLGPGGDLAAVTRSAFAPGTMLELGVVVGGNGVAEVPLSSEVSSLTPDELDAAMAQLARTLRQVPGIERVRVTVNGAPVPLKGGLIDLGVGHGSALDPALEISDPAPVVFRGGRLTRSGVQGNAVVGGPLSRPGFAVRSLAFDEDQHRVAAVAANGRKVFIAPTRGNGPVRTLANQLTNVQRPSFDMFGNLWLLDRTPRGARLFVLDPGGDLRARPIRVPGLTGRSVTAFTVTHDGTRLLAVLAGGASPEVRDAPILRDVEGRVDAGARVRRVELPGSELGAAVDIGQVAPTTIAVVTRPADGPDLIVYAELDGAPGGPDQVPPVEVPQRVAQLVVGPVAGMPLRVITADGRLLRFSGADQWISDKGRGIRAAAYPR